jgi:hypothetical protein
MIQVLTDIFAAMTIEGKPFVMTHGNKHFLNYIADNKKFPFSHLDSPLLAKLALASSGYIGRTYPVKIFFLWKSEPGWTPVQHEQLAISKARIAINQFIARCEASPTIDSISDCAEQEFINLFDAHTSGIILSCNIKPRNYDSACES